VRPRRQAVQTGSLCATVPASWPRQVWRSCLASTWRRTRSAHAFYPWCPPWQLRSVHHPRPEARLKLRPPLLARPEQPRCGGAQWRPLRHNRRTLVQACDDCTGRASRVNVAVVSGRRARLSSTGGAERSRDHARPFTAARRCCLEGGDTEQDYRCAAPLPARAAGMFKRSGEYRRWLPWERLNVWKG
jgi:hypothetical protein